MEELKGDGLDGMQEAVSTCEWSPCYEDVGVETLGELKFARSHSYEGLAKTVSSEATTIGGEVNRRVAVF